MDEKNEREATEEDDNILVCITRILLLYHEQAQNSRNK